MKTNKNSVGLDGLEAWCVAFSACVINFIMSGLGRTSGILYVAFIDIFHVNRLQASVPFSARSLARNLFGPVVGILGQKYGVRKTTLVGGIIATLSAISCFYTMNIIWITVLWGVLNGAGAALSMTLPQVVLNQHFKKYRTTASGMAFSGGCVGSFLFPVLVEYLLKTYGLGGSFLILSGILMNVIPAAMVLRKPSWLKKQQNIEVISEENNKNNSCNGRNDEENFNYRIKNFKEYKNGQWHKIEDYKDFPIRNIYNLLQVDTSFLRENGDLFLKLLENIKSSVYGENFGENDILLSLPEGIIQKYLEYLYKFIDSMTVYLSSSDVFVSNISSKHFDTKSRYGYSHNVSKNTTNEIVLSVIALELQNNLEFCSSLLKQLNRFTKNYVKNFPNILSKEEHEIISLMIRQIKHIFSVLNIDESDGSLKTSQNKNKVFVDKSTDKHTNTFKTHIKTAIRLHKNPLFLLISVSRSVHFLTFVPALTIIVDFSMDKGLLEEDGKYVIAALSFGDLMGRLCLGWITDKEYLSLPTYMFLVMVMQCACTATLSLMISKPALLSLIVLFGLLQGSLFVRHPVLVSKYLDSQEQSVAMGCINFFSGLLGFALPSYIGYFRDIVGSYDYIFYINGAIGTLVGVLWFFEPYFIKYTRVSQQENQELF